MGNKNNKNATRPLNEQEIQLLVSNTGLSRQEVVDWHQKFLLEFSDGLIDKKEFVNIYKQVYREG